MVGPVTTLGRFSLALAVVLAAVTPLVATDLSIASAGLSFDPNAATWYITSKVCNTESGGYAGSTQYEIRLLAGGRFWMIGSKKVTDTLNAGYCRSFTRQPIKVNTNVPAGTYEIQFVVAEYRDGRYVVRDTTKFSKTFIRGGGQP